MPNSWVSLRRTAVLIPMCRVSLRSWSQYSGCEQHEFVRYAGKVTFASARCWRRSLPLLKTKRLNARCSNPALMFTIWWQTSLVSARTWQSFSSTTMHLSCSSCSCISTSYLCCVHFKYTVDLSFFLFVFLFLFYYVFLFLFFSSFFSFFFSSFLFFFFLFFFLFYIL